MSLPTNIGAFGPELDLFDQAIGDTKGLRIYYDTEEMAYTARSRFHQARALQRTENKRVYPPTDPLYGTCPYDAMICRLRKADPEPGWWLYIERHGIAVDRVEVLSELD